MQIRALRVFCDIANQRSFSRAAEMHGMTQSAASQIVLHLEEDLKVQLIDRSKRPLVLTSAGQLYYEGLQRILRDYQALDAEVRSFGKRLAGARRSCFDLLGWAQLHARREARVC